MRKRRITHFILAAALGMSMLNVIAAGAAENGSGIILTAKSMSIPVDAAHFPDAAFRAIITNRAGGNTISPETIQKIKVLDLSNAGITSLEGIQYFTELTDLLCSGNRLTSLDLSGNPKLTTLCCSDNQLKYLNVSCQAALDYLNCRGNQLAALDLSNNTKLTILDCALNQLTDLDLHSNTNLQGLYCFKNNLTCLDLSSNRNLIYADCTGNTRSVTLTAAGTIDLASLSGSFRADRVSDLSGATLIGSTLTFQTGTSEASYSYSCGSGERVDFYLKALNPPVSAAGLQTQQYGDAGNESDLIYIKTITINKTVSGLKLKASGKNIIVSWPKIKKKVSKSLYRNIQKVEIQFSPDQYFRYDVGLVSAGKAKTRAKLKGLERNTTYYVRVRYANAKGGVSRWSSTARVRTK